MGTLTMSQTTTVLTSWKDIARYMGKGVRTVQRWEMDFGLPVRRPQGSNKKAVLARPHDLDAWVALRCSSREQSKLANGENKNLPLGKIVQLRAEIETARALRERNQVLLDEMRLQLDFLRRQLTELNFRPPDSSRSPRPGE